ncbi:DUF2388 domain-containing protein [Pseudomonas protegens]|uniref:DUF2388 domain-containing protein n=1 Tax=Pseudomonas protegens TaxID=380021 RepID=UPI003805CE51
MNLSSLTKNKTVMRKFFAVSSFVFGLVSEPAMAMNDFWAETISSGTTSGTTYLTSRDKKSVLATEDDANCFVASDGALRGPYIEAAMRKFRNSYPEVVINDLDLAKSILVRTQQVSVRP